MFDPDEIDTFLERICLLYTEDTQRGAFLVGGKRDSSSVRPVDLKLPSRREKGRQVSDN